MPRSSALEGLHGYLETLKGNIKHFLGSVGGSDRLRRTGRAEQQEGFRRWHAPGGRTQPPERDDEGARG